MLCIDSDPSSRSDEGTKTFAHLADPMTNPEYAFSKTTDKTCFALAHGKPLFDMLSDNVRDCLFSMRVEHILTSR